MVHTSVISVHMNEGTARQSLTNKKIRTSCVFLLILLTLQSISNLQVLPPDPINFNHNPIPAAVVPCNGIGQLADGAPATELVSFRKVSVSIRSQINYEDSPHITENFG